MKKWVLFALILAALAALTALTGTASAQSAPVSHPLSVSVGSGWGGLWDDETNLGRGLPLAAGVVLPLGDHLQLSGDVDWTHHTRNAGYLTAKSDLLAGMVRGTFAFGSPRASVRPFAGIGLGVMRSSGTLAFQSLLPQASQALPSEAWTLTRAAYDLHGGVRVALSDRIALRPEYRWRATFGSAHAGRGIEPPLLNLQALIHVDVGF